MNTEAFTGKAEAYAKARPGYPAEAVEYIVSLVPQNAVFDCESVDGLLRREVVTKVYSERF